MAASQMLHSTSSYQHQASITSMTEWCSCTLAIDSELNSFKAEYMDCPVAEHLQRQQISATQLRFTGESHLKIAPLQQHSAAAPRAPQ